MRQKLKSPWFTPARRKTAKGVLTTTLILCQTAVDGLPIPGLKASLGSLLEVIRGLDKTGQNEQALLELDDHLKNLTDRINKYSGESDVPPGLQENINLLANTLQTIAQDGDATHSGRSFLHRFFNREDNELTITGLNERIKQSIAEFQLRGDIDTQVTMHRDHRKLEGQINEYHKEVISEVKLARLEKLPRADRASFDDVSRAEAPACFENTRKEVLETINSWVQDSSPKAPRIFWLNGIAGIGKSTISKTIAKSAAQNNQLGASFFFSRQEVDLRKPDLVFSTLAYQLAYHYHPFKVQIANALDLHPGAGRAELPLQFEKLILTPLKNAGVVSSPVLIVLDALDECEGKGMTTILRLLTYEHYAFPPFIKFLITSRPERDITSIFNRSPHNQVILHHIDETTVENDIRLLLQGRLSQVPNEFQECTNWDMKDSELEELVKKSAGLFIVASTVVKFIMDERHSDPRGRLDVLFRDHVSLSASHSAVDALYLQVLNSAIPETDLGSESLVARFRDVVGCMLVLCNPLPIKSMQQFLETQSQPGYVVGALRFLHSVIAVPTGDEPLRFHHPSFPDFIVDPGRCYDKRFLIDKGQYHTRIALSCFRLIEEAATKEPDCLQIEISNNSELGYACRYWVDHLLDAPPESHSALLNALQCFTSRHVLYWLGLMYRLEYWYMTVLTLKRAYEWAISFSGPVDLLMLLNDAKWFIPIYLDNLTFRVQKLGSVEEVIKLCASAGDIYLEHCTDGELKRPAVFQPSDKGSVDHLGTYLDGQEQAAEALKVLLHAAKMRGMLAAEGPNELRFQVAWFLDRLTKALTEKDQIKDALYVGEEAVSIHRTLVAEYPDTATEGPLFDTIRFFVIKEENTSHLFVRPPALPGKHSDFFRQELVESLEVLCTLYWKSDSFEKGLLANDELVSIHRSRAAEQPENFDKDLAKFLNNFCCFCIEAGGKFEKGLQASEGLVAINRTLAAIEPDLFRKELSQSLSILSFFCWNLGSFERCLQVKEEAVSIYRTLVAYQPHIFRRHLASTLVRLGQIYSDRAHFPKGLQASEEAVSICRTLVTNQSDAAQADLAESLSCLGQLLEDSGRLDEALGARQESLDIYRTLSVNQPDAFQIGLASSLNSLGWFLQKRGLSDKALEAAKESLVICRTITAEQLSGTSRGRRHLLSAVLDTVAVCLHKLGRQEDARPFGRESMDISSRLCQDYPEIIGYRANQLEIFENHLEVLESMGCKDEEDEIRKKVEEIKQSSQGLALSSADGLMPFLSSQHSFVNR